MTFEEQRSAAITKHLHKQQVMVATAIIPVRLWHKDKGSSPFRLPYVTDIILN